MNLIKYATMIGFKEPQKLKTRKPHKFLAFSFTGFDVAQVRSVFGKPKAHAPSILLFTIDKERGALVNTEKNWVILANGADAVRALANKIKS